MHICVCFLYGVNSWQITGPQWTWPCSQPCRHRPWEAKVLLAPCHLPPHGAITDAAPRCPCQPSSAFGAFTWSIPFGAHPKRKDPAGSPEVWDWTPGGVSPRGVLGDTPEAQLARGLAAPLHSGSKTRHPQSQEHLGNHIKQ